MELRQVKEILLPSNIIHKLLFVLLVMFPYVFFPLPVIVVSKTHLDISLLN